MLIAKMKSLRIISLRDQLIKDKSYTRDKIKIMQIKILIENKVNLKVNLIIKKYKALKYHNKQLKKKIVKNTALMIMI
jgi:hypothetical protein